MSFILQLFRRSIGFGAPLILGVLWTGAAQAETDPPPEGINFTVVVYDGTNNNPLELARVALYRGSTLIKGKVTNTQGRAIFSDVTPGKYRLLVRSVGYN